MPEFHYLVTVSGCDLDQAQRVMNERLNHDEDYGFKYDLEAEFVEGKPLFMLTTADVTGVLRRPLVRGEERPVRKALEHALSEDWNEVLLGWDDPESTEMGAGGLAPGHWFREYGMDDWYLVTKADWHGDTALLWVEDIEGNASETSLDGDTVVELLVTNFDLRS